MNITEPSIGANEVAPGTFLRNEIRRISTNRVWLFLAGMIASMAVFAGLLASLDDRKSHSERIDVWLVILVVVALVCLVLMILELQTRTAPHTHGAVRPLLAHYGVPLDELSRWIEHEQGASRVPWWERSTFLLPSWIYVLSTFSFELLRIDELAWVYKRSTTRYENGFNRGTSHALIAHPLYDPTVVIAISTLPEEIDRLIQHIARQAPWVYTGWDSVRKQTWDAPEGRQHVVATIQMWRDHARMSAAAAASSPRAPADRSTQPTIADADTRDDEHHRGHLPLRIRAPVAAVPRSAGLHDVARQGANDRDRLRAADR
jgi:hypothetical protein